jgi:hypothetical protein
VANNNFRFTDYPCLSHLTGVLRGDPWWTYEVYDAHRQEFVDKNGPDAIIPVSSVSLLIYKETGVEIEECPGLDGHVARFLATSVESSNGLASSSSVQRSVKSVSSMRKSNADDTMKPAKRAKFERPESDDDVIDPSATLDDDTTRANSSTVGRTTNNVGDTGNKAAGSLSAGGTKKKKEVDNSVVPPSSEERPSKRRRNTARMSTGGKAPGCKRQNIVDLTWMSDG